MILKMCHPRKVPFARAYYAVHAELFPQDRLVFFFWQLSVLLLCEFGQLTCLTSSAGVLDIVPQTVPH
jgi:hypothetical protein